MTMAQDSAYTPAGPFLQDLYFILESMSNRIPVGAGLLAKAGLNRRCPQAGPPWGN